MRFSLDEYFRKLYHHFVMQKYSHLFIFLLFIFSTSHSKCSLPADISFLIADYKYNEAQGVKICEIQAGILTVFTAYDDIYGVRGLLADQFCDCFTSFEPNIWYTPAFIAESTFKYQCKHRGWQPVRYMSKLKKSNEFLEIATQPVEDPTSIDSYHGLLYASISKVSPLSEFRKEYPGMLVLGGATLPYWSDKLKWSQLFEQNRELQQYKPQWKEYPTTYSEMLVNEILTDFSSEILVIKPRYAFCGDGVILVKREELDETLHLIFQKKDIVKKIKDSSYRYWRKKRGDFFIIEEFVPSDPITVPKYNNRSFDGTARSVFLLIYDQGQIHVHFLETHWKLPTHSLDQAGSLNKLHKSAGPMDCEMHPLTQKKLESSLEPGLRLLYQDMLH